MMSRKRAYRRGTVHRSLRLPTISAYTLRFPDEFQRADLISECSSRPISRGLASVFA
jgi:hypothetical protein